METLLSIAIALTAGLFVSRFAKLFKLPAVTGYLVAGIIVGPYVLGLIGIEGLGFVSHDKKCQGDRISVIYVPEIGKFEIQTVDVAAFCDRVRPILGSMI